MSAAKPSKIDEIRSAVPLALAFFYFCLRRTVPLHESEAVSRDVYNAACKCPVRRTAKAVLLQLAWYADDNGENVWPKVSTIAERTSLTRRAVQKVLRELESQQIIFATGSRLRGRARSTHYCINLARLSFFVESANNIRPLPQKKSESQDIQRANSTPIKGAQRSPEENNNEKEKETATPYEVQAFRARIRKAAKSKAIPTMDDQQARVRQAFLQGQKVGLLAREAQQPRSETAEDRDD